jgi:F0F1-type ATP synthase membrane subunit b/b'
MNPTLLQIFLLINVFLIGALTTVAVQHAYAHFRPRSKTDKPQPAPGLPPAVRKQILETAQADFQAVLEKSAVELQRELHGTAVSLNQRIAKTGAEVVNSEMERYHAQLDELRKQAEQSIGGAEKQIAGHQEELKTKLAEKQAELEAKLTEEMAAEKQHLVQQMDTKLADAVASFLTETLQHDIDLGAQSRYLIAMLEEHKAEISKGVVDEV